MKKLILTLMAGSLAAGSFAHDGGNSCFKMGSILLYGVGSYSNSHGSDQSSFASASSTTIDRPRMLNWQVSPGIGFNVTDNLTVGVDLNYTGSKSSIDRNSFGAFTGYSVDQTKTYSLGIGPFVRYTWPVGEHFFAYGQFEAHYLRGNVAQRYTNASGSNQFGIDAEKYKGVDASFMPAIGVMVCHSVGLTFGIGGISYDYRKTDYNNPYAAAGTSQSSKTNNFNVSFGSQFNIGVQKYFGCGHKMHGHHEPMDETRQMDTSDDSSDDSGDKKRHRKHDDE